MLTQIITAPSARDVGASDRKLSSGTRDKLGPTSSSSNQYQVTACLNQYLKGQASASLQGSDRAGLTGGDAAQLLHSAAGGGVPHPLGTSNSSSTSDTGDTQQLSGDDEASAGTELTVAITSSSRTASPAPPIMDQVEQVLYAANEWQYDAFELTEATRGHPLSTLAFFLFSKQGLVEHFQLKPIALARFLRRIEAGYKTNPYHNATHAADVLQTMHCIITRGGLMPGYVDPMHLMACYTAAVSVADVDQVDDPGWTPHCNVPLLPAVHMWASVASCGTCQHRLDIRRCNN